LATEEVDDADRQSAGTRPDWTRLEELLGGSSELARDVVDLLRLEAPRLFAVLNDNCNARNAREARRAAHTLKSNLRNVGFEDVASLSGTIEKLALVSDWDALPGKLVMLEAEIQSVVHWCDEMLAMR
jgi:HPt (histidine-containing phosphotransfer) domain-containing protein